jgi:galactose-1-phosphate uridylyltransferase
MMVMLMSMHAWLHSHGQHWAATIHDKTVQNSAGARDHSADVQSTGTCCASKTLSQRFGRALDATARATAILPFWPRGPAGSDKVPSKRPHACKPPLAEQHKLLQPATSQDAFSMAYLLI